MADTPSGPVPDATPPKPAVAEPQVAKPTTRDMDDARVTGIGEKLWSWTVVGAIVLFLVAGGISFMTSGHPWIADGFYIAGAILFLTKFLTWEEAKPQDAKKSRRVIVPGAAATLMLSALAILGNHRMNALSATALTKEAIAGEVWKSAPKVPVPSLPAKPREDQTAILEKGSRWTGETAKPDNARPKDMSRPRLHIYRFDPLKHPATNALGVNVFFKVDGVQANSIKSFYRIVAARFPGDDNEVPFEDSLFDGMLNSTPVRSDIGGAPVGRELYVSVLGDPMANEIVEKVRDKKVAVYFMGRFEYAGADKHQYYSEYCGFLMGDPAPVFMCKHHNTEP